ncbi:MAG: AsmA-like C-terminal region-containing protein [Bacteroidales bacterium]|nr:AsmA-like C-terminal region-containing protein [Bacteroidales bacterium]
MKKIIRIIVITLGVILLLLITLPILFKSKIEALVKQEGNKQVEATVDWDKFSLTFFRGFPDLSVNLHGLSVTGKDVFAGDTLMYLDRFEFRVRPFSALKKDIVVKSILLNRPVINAVVLEDGTANWDIAPAPGAADRQPEGKTEAMQEADKGETDQSSKAGKADKADAEPGSAVEEEESGAAMNISLERFAIINGRVTYTDAASDLSAAIGDLNLEVRGDFGMEQTDMEMVISISGIRASSGGIGYMRNGTIEMDVTAAADMANSIYSLKKNEIRINGLVLGAEGTVKMPEDGSIIPDIRYFSQETSFKTLLSLVPAIYLQDFEALETSGSLALEGTVTGVMKDSVLPDVTLALQVRDGYFSYPDLPKDVSEVAIDLDVDYRGSDMDATTVDLEKFHLLLGGNPFDMQVRVATPFSDMQVAGMIRGVIDFSSLQDIVTMEDLNLSGRLDADMQWNTRMSSIENEEFEKVNLDGKLIVEGMVVEAPEISVPVQLEKMALYFTPRYVNLETLDLVMGSSDLHLDGRLTNFIPYVFDDQTVGGSLNVTSALLDVNELMPAEEKTGEAAGESDGSGGNTDQGDDPGGEPDMEANGTAGSEIKDMNAENPGKDKDTGNTGTGTGGEMSADTLAPSTQMKIPENIDFVLTLDMQKVIYDNIVIEHLTGNARVQEGVAFLEGLTMELLEGNVSLAGVVDPRGAFTSADVQIDISDIDIPSSYETFVAIERLAPIAQHVEGSANVDMQLTTLLDADFNPLYGTIDADGHLFARDLKVEQPASLEKLAAALKNEKLRNLELEKADIRFSIRDGRVIVEPFDMDFEDSKITAYGSHGIDQTMDYTLDMEIAKSDMGAGANEIMNSLGNLAAGAGFSVPQSDFIKVKANITGTFKDPTVTTDLRGNLTSARETVKEAVKERVTEEVEQVEEQVRDEAEQKAEELIRKAEEEKAQLVAEAQKAGNKLVAEARKQGEQLVEDAGNNPLKKIAANRAAEELIKQAEKQAASLVKEAEEKGDTIIARAKEEAGKI